MTFWTLRDASGAYYIDEFIGFSKDSFTDETAKMARMGYSTMQEFYNNGFEKVKVKLVEIAE